MSYGVLWFVSLPTLIYIPFRCDCRLKPLGDEEGFQLFGYRDKCLKLTIRHGKTDRQVKRDMFRVVVGIPDSDLAKLWMTHIISGRSLLTLECPSPPPTMFMSGYKNPFVASTLIHWWKDTMRTTSILNYFPPSKARTIFCDEFRRVHGHNPELEEGAAAIMGNSPEQWTASYTPNRKRRLAQSAVDAVVGYRVARDEGSESE